MSNYVFKVADFSGISVALAVTVWEEKILSPTPIGHPEVAPYLEEIRLAIIEPDFVFQSARRPDSRLFYRFSVGRERYHRLHVVVAVKYVDEPEGLHGYVSTAYLTSKIYSRGMIVWKKPGAIAH